jgi:hypothetical protein
LAPVILKVPCLGQGCIFQGTPRQIQVHLLEKKVFLDSLEMPLEIGDMLDWCSIHKARHELGIDPLHETIPHSLEHGMSHERILRLQTIIRQLLVMEFNIAVLVGTEAAPVHRATTCSIELNVTTESVKILIHGRQGIGLRIFLEHFGRNTPSVTLYIPARTRHAHSIRHDITITRHGIDAQASTKTLMYIHKVRYSYMNSYLVYVVFMQ